MRHQDRHEMDPRYIPPTDVGVMSVTRLLEGTARASLTQVQLELLASMAPKSESDVPLFIAGDHSLLKRRCISIIGAREASEGGRARARRLARELTEGDVVVMSGLAEGIDTTAIQSAIDSQGHIVAVIGTPLDQAYPASNKRLQEQIYQRHLLISQFHSGQRVFQSNFPMRNRLMALLSDATVVIEASDSSGTLHQAAECIRLGRWLYIARNVVENRTLTWPGRFLPAEKCRILDSTEDLVRTVYS
jgi:DNA processing protein